MDLTTAIAEGSGQPVLLAATALALGALHGLEPGHSKTMMAAFIIAVRGTVGQAVLLGLSAAVSHTLIVWILALLALRFGEEMIGEALEPWFLMASGVIVLVIAAWMVWQARRAIHRRTSAAAAAPAPGPAVAGVPAPAQGHPALHGHTHDHPHDHTQAPLDGPGHPLPREGSYEDAHAAAHAREIEARIGTAGPGRTTHTQTVLFGLTGGLIPCSAAITVLILCLHLDRFWLGVGLVGAFSGGLAVTLVLAGVVAALGVRTVSRRTRRLDRLLARAPYVSAGLIAVVGVAMIGVGWTHLPTAPAG
ncbi:nickel/cobalt efflux transporter [Roseospira goensis]|uniref:Nickel/cobalt efflux system n=1 Tax=Roseospira goensis TaxID=391922 RepID=A0A7W6RZ49_9PROT|nr:nickel/cobalt efflux transporter [Roseospira goensis]MBB4285919.1 nickel/cobalt exporter [Roseospira goensis]